MARVRALRRVARYGATVGWVVSLPFSLAAAVNFALSWAMTSGMPVALRGLDWSR